MKEIGATIINLAGVFMHSRSPVYTRNAFIYSIDFEINLFFRIDALSHRILYTGSIAIIYGDFLQSI